MKLKKGFELKKIGSDTVAIYTAGDTVRLQDAVVLNSTAATLWKALEQGSTGEELVGLLRSGYGVAAEKAEADVDSFVNELREKGFLI